MRAEKERGGLPPQRSRPKVAPTPPPSSTITSIIAGRGDGPGHWRQRGRRLCPRRRPWWSAAIAEASAELGSLEAVYAELDSHRCQREAAALALSGRRRRDFEAGLYTLDGLLTLDKVFRQFVAERPGLRLPTPAEAAASWPEPEVS